MFECIAHRTAPKRKNRGKHQQAIHILKQSPSHQKDGEVGSKGGDTHNARCQGNEEDGLHESAGDVCGL